MAGFFHHHKKNLLCVAITNNGPTLHHLHPKQQQQQSINSTNSSTMTNTKTKAATYQSKRQRRASGPNPTNTWQQQPKIKSAGARAKAYITYAGLADEQNYSIIKQNHNDEDNTNTNNNNKSTSTSSMHLLDPQLELDSPEIKFGRLLGGTDQRCRHGAVKMLRAYLSSRADFTLGGIGLSELDLLKLWKGLWYTLYMADKAPVQDKLSKILAELMWSVAGTVEEDEYAGNVYLQMQEDGLLDDDDDYDENMEGAEKEEYDDDNGYDEVVYVDNDGDVMQIVEMNSNSSDDEYDESSEDGIDLDEIGENEIYEVDQTDSDDNEEESDSDDDDENPTLTFLAGSNSDDDEFNEEDDGDGEVDDEQQRIQDMNEKHCRGAHLVSLYISTFICTVRREWGNVDKHRVDKFYTAVRFMISEAYKYMSKRSWNIGIIQLFNDAIYNEGLAAETPGLTNGLRYHLIDICIDELAKVSKESELPLTEATFLDCLEPFFGLAQSAVDKNVQQRVMQNVLLKFLNEYSVVCAAAASTEDGEEKDTDYNASLIFRQVHVGTVSKFIFSIASDSETDERYRKSLYEMHKAYSRQIRLAGMDVDIDDHNSEEEEEDEEYESKTVGDDFCNKVDEMQGSTRKEDILKEKSNIKDEVAVSIEQGKSVTTDVPSGQKKKRKKKNKTEKSEENGIANAPAGAGAGAVVKAIDHEPKTKSLSKNKRKEKQHSVKSEVTEVKTSIPVSEKAVKTEESTTPVTKSSKKKRKLQNGNESTDDNVAKEDFITTHVETPSVNSSKKKKSKKQQTSSPPSVHPRAMSSPDQASFEEELGGINDDNDGHASPSKRVSFGAVNRAKSHKASMKAIKTLDKSRWDTATRTPDKGILHPRIALMSSEKKKARAPLSQLSSSTKKGKRS